MDDKPTVIIEESITRTTALAIFMRPSFLLDIRPSVAKITLKLSPLTLLEQLCKGMWKTPMKCIWGLMWLCSAFYILLCFDISNISTTSLIWIAVVEITVIIAFYLLCRYRSTYYRRKPAAAAAAIAGDDEIIGITAVNIAEEDQSL